MQKLTIDQAVVVMGYTGVACAPWPIFHADVERRAGRRVSTAEFPGIDTCAMYRDDFVALLPHPEDPMQELVEVYRAALAKAKVMQSGKADAN